MTLPVTKMLLLSIVTQFYSKAIKHSIALKPVVSHIIALGIIFLSEITVKHLASTRSCFTTQCRHQQQMHSLKLVDRFEILYLLKI